MPRSSAAEAIGYEEAQERLVRKQFLISSAQEAKLKQLAKDHGVSAGEMVRRAIDAYDPDGFSPEEEKILGAMLDMAEKSVHSAIARTDATIKNMDKLLARLDAQERQR